MQAFISSTPIAVSSRHAPKIEKQRSKHLHVTYRSCPYYRAVPTCQHAPRNRDDRGHDATLSMDLLSSFDALCWRAQQSLCEEASAADGLGTFNEVPYVTSDFKPSSITSNERIPRRKMRGGRAFSHASIDVVRSRTNPSAPSSTSSSSASFSSSTSNLYTNERESVGVTVNLHPRHPQLPSLRASVHYFQIGGGRLAWWFTGSADICIQTSYHQLQSFVPMFPSSSPSPSSPTSRKPLTSSSADFVHAFSNLSNRFFNVWHGVCDRYRAPKGCQEPAISFLSDCLNDTGTDPFIHQRDRDVSFHFASDVIDGLLPAYLPLLSDPPNFSVFNDVNQHSSGKQRRNSEKLSHTQFGDILFPDSWAPFIDEEGMGSSGEPEENVETFSLSGGATCETSTMSVSPLGSWRFSLSPSSLTSAGKAYSSLRDNIDGSFSQDLYF